MVGVAALALWFSPSSLLVLSFGMFVQAFHVEFGWPIGRVTLGGSIISIMIMLLSPLQGWLADRVGVRRLILTSFPFWGIGIGAMAALPADIRLFYLACAILPVLGLGLWPLSYLKIVATWFEHRLGLAFGMTNAGLGISTVVLPLALQAVFASLGWRTAYLLLAVMIVCLILPVAAVFLRERGVPTIARPDADIRERTGNSLREALRTRSYLVTLASFWLLGGVSGALLINQIGILIEGGLSPQRAAAMQAAIGVGTIVGRIGGGWLLDRASARWVGLATGLSAAVASLLLTRGADNFGAGAAAFLLGVALGGEFDILAVVIRRYQGLRYFGRLFGIVFAIFNLGSALAVAGMAFAHGVYGSYGPGLVALAAAGTTAGMLFLLLGSHFYPDAEIACSAPA